MTQNLPCRLIPMMMIATIALVMATILFAAAWVPPIIAITTGICTVFILFIILAISIWWNHG